MARTNLPLSNFVANGGLADPAGTTIDQANGMNVALASSAIPSAASADRLVLRVANTAASPFNVIVRAGGAAGAGNPPAFRSALGDLTVSVTNATTKWVGPLDLSRFVQADGSLNVDFGVGFTGTITAFLLPKNTGN